MFYVVNMQYLKLKKVCRVERNNIVLFICNALYIGLSKRNTIILPNYYFYYNLILSNVI